MLLDVFISFISVCLPPPLESAEGGDCCETTVEISMFAKSI